MEPDLNAILQEQLRDIHLPEPISWWPPAPGWWILLIIAVALICFAIWKLRDYQQRNRYRKQALLELKRIYEQWQNDANIAVYLQAANALLKRAVKVAAQDGNQSAALSGKDWANLLNNWSRTALSDVTIYALTQAEYQANPQVDIETLQTEIALWLKLHKQPNRQEQPHKKKSTLPDIMMGERTDA